MTKRKPPSDRRPSLQPGTPEWHAHIQAVVDAAPEITDEKARRLIIALGPDFFALNPPAEKEDDQQQQ